MKYIYLDSPFEARKSNVKDENYYFKRGESCWIGFKEEKNLTYHNYCRNFDGNYEKGIGFIDEDILEYHSGYRFYNLKEKEKFSIGIEVESEYGIDFESVGQLNQRNLWIKERDGSLDEDNGFELISPCYSFDIDLLKKELLTLGEYYEGLESSSDSCGNHIHIGLGAKTNDDTGRSIFEMISGYIPLLCALYPKRRANSYCKGLSKREVLECGRGAVSINSGKTCEIRIFPFVKSYKQLIWRIELIKIFLENPTDCNREVIANCLNSGSDLYNHLAKVYSISKYTEMIARLSKETYKLESIDIPYEELPLISNECKIERIKGITNGYFGRSATMDISL